MAVKHWLRTGIALGALQLAVAGPALATPLIGVVGGAFGFAPLLVAFDSAAPSVITSTLTVTGLNGELIRGIDIRPSNGQIYALGGSGTLFQIDGATGAATSIGLGVPVTTADLAFGASFNPVADALRVVTATDLNLRVSPNTGITTTDTALAYAASDFRAGSDPKVTGIAYTNQVAGATSTALYGIDVNTSSLVRQNPPNGGTLSSIGLLGVNLFNFGPGFGVGFDIDGATNTAFASLTDTVGTAGLYTIDLATGGATLLGLLGQNNSRLITVGQFGSTPVPVPEPASLSLLAMGLFGLAVARRRRRQA